jgi:hypothetical protein
VTVDPSPSREAVAARCHVARCGTVATYTPVLCVLLSKREHVSRVALPVHVCSDHRETFMERFLTVARRTAIEASLRAHGRGSPDWSRTYLDFVTMPQRLVTPTAR